MRLSIAGDLGARTRVSGPLATMNGEGISSSDESVQLSIRGGDMGSSGSSAQKKKKKRRRVIEVGW